MRTDILTAKTAPVAVDRLLVDTPLSSLLNNSLLFGAFENNMLETAQGYTLEIAVPGMKRRDLEVEVADGVLTIRGQKQQKAGFGWTGKVMGYRSTQIYRTIMLPWDADQHRIKAECKDGLLRISIPKPGTRKRSRTITVEGTEEAGWWQRAASPFRKLKDKMSKFLDRLRAGSGKSWRLKR